MITCVGDLVEDVIVHAPLGVRTGTDSPARIERHRGGSAANVAVAASSIGASARFVGNVGDDSLGEYLLGELRVRGVDTAVSRMGRTGSIVALIDGDGERSFLTDRGSANELNAVPVGALAGCSVLHVPMYSLLTDPLRATTLTIIQQAQLAGLTVSLDASSTGAILDAGVESARELIARVEPDVLFCNGPEAALLDVQTRQLAATTVIKHGAEPTWVISSEGVSTHVVPVVRQVVDTTGAGDAFAAGYLVTSLDGASKEAAVAAAHELAARTLSGFGATPK